MYRSRFNDCVNVINRYITTLDKMDHLLKTEIFLHLAACKLADPVPPLLDEFQLSEPSLMRSQTLRINAIPKLPRPPAQRFEAPVKRSKLFTQQHTTFVYHLLHVVACCSLGQWSNASNSLPNIVQLYNLLWIVRLKLFAPRGIIRRNLLTNSIPIRSYYFDQ